MAFAVELYFDTTSEAAVRAIWRELAERGIARSLHESENRPHVSLAVYEQLQLVECERALRRFADETAPFPLTLSDLGVFPIAHEDQEAVVFAAPTVTRHLLDLHEEMHRLLGPLGRSPWAYYLPGAWTPHCTLAFRLPARLVPDALAVCRRLALPLDCRVEAIGVNETGPAKPLFAHRLRPATRRS